MHDHADHQPENGDQLADQVNPRPLGIALAITGTFL